MKLWYTKFVADVIDNQFYEADCYIRGTNLVAKYNYWNGDKSEYTYYTQNAHGDVVNLTDKEGKVTKSYRYDAFGVEISPDSEDVNVFRFCGEYYDKETATVYLRARYYQASTGRFISRDSCSGKKSDPLSLNLYTYCRNNPISYVDPSGYSYATLPNGKRMSINSASDAKLFNELKSGKSQSSQVKTTTPIIQDSPITGGITTQQSTTTYTTIQTTEQFYASQKKNTDIFSQINKGLNWFDKHITTPFIDSTVKFGKAVYHSTSLEIGGGFGFGAEGKLGAVNGSLLVVPIRDEYIIADDCKTNMTSKFSANAEFGEIIGAGAETKCSAYNGNGDGISWMMPGHEWECQFGLISKNSEYSISNQEVDPHFTLSVGGSIYLFVGADISLSFDVDKFCECLGWK